jgi:hypothetical protein
MLIQRNVSEIKTRIEGASDGRPVKLIAVSKTFPAERVREAWAAGLTIFGENRIQEAVPKIQSLQDLAIEWHLVGHLQTNKARDAVRHFSCIQSIDSLKILNHVEKEAAKQQKKIDALLEINIGDEESKHGFSETDLSAALQTGRELEWCTVRGLMIIPPFFEDPEKVRPYFRRMRELRTSLAADYPAVVELSMGMSHDFEIAIQEGATMVRIGAALFGERA